VFGDVGRSQKQVLGRAGTQQALAVLPDLKGAMMEKKTPRITWSPETDYVLHDMAGREIPLNPLDFDGAVGEALEVLPEWTDDDDYISAEKLIRNSDIDQLVSPIISEIQSWDLDDIHKLKGLLEELDAALGSTDFSLEDFVDITELPSAKIPDDIDTGYPVWAMDNDGFCLTGKTIDDIEHVDRVRGCYE
jgi:hypothetical protein